MANILRFKVLASPGSNDHQTRVVIDGVDWLGEEVLGLDPQALQRQLAAEEARLIVGRCRCGAVGCDDLTVDVRRQDDRVEWIASGRQVSFDGVAYRAEVERFVADESWEDLGRQVERQVEGVFAGATIEGTLSFDWASTRIRPSVVHLSFSNEGGQRLLDFNWDGATAASALTRARTFYRERCDETFEVDEGVDTGAETA